MRVRPVVVAASLLLAVGCSSHSGPLTPEVRPARADKAPGFAAKATAVVIWINAEELRGCKSLGMVWQVLHREPFEGRWLDDPGAESALRLGTALLNGNAARLSVSPYVEQCLEDGKTIYARTRTVGEAYICPQANRDRAYTVTGIDLALRRRMDASAALEGMTAMTRSWPGPRLSGPSTTKASSSARAIEDETEGRRGAIRQAD